MKQLSFDGYIWKLMYDDGDGSPKAGRTGSCYACSVAAGMTKHVVGHNPDTGDEICTYSFNDIEQETYMYRENDNSFPMEFCSKHAEELKI